MWSELQARLHHPSSNGLLASLWTRKKPSAERLSLIFTLLWGQICLLPQRGLHRRFLGSRNGTASGTDAGLLITDEISKRTGSQAHVSLNLLLKLFIRKCFSRLFYLVEDWFFRKYGLELLLVYHRIAMQIQDSCSSKIFFLSTTTRLKLQRLSSSRSLDTAKATVLVSVIPRRAW